MGSMAEWQFLQPQRRAIVEKIAKVDPNEALDLLWKLMALASSVFERCDDSNGTVGNVFRSACNDLATLALDLWAQEEGYTRIEPGLAGILVLPESKLVGVIGVVLIIAGLSLITWAYLRLHSFKLIATIQPDHQLCVEGPYSRIRHPVYSGMSLFYLGSFFLAPRSGILILTLCIILIGHLRSLMEERALASAFGHRYTEYMSRTYRYIPWLC